MDGCVWVHYCNIYLCVCEFLTTQAHDCDPSVITHNVLHSYYLAFIMNGILCLRLKNHTPEGNIQ